MIQNDGVRQIKEDPRAWIAGGETAIQYKVNNVSGDWTPYLSKDETQSGNGMDTLNCVSSSATNCGETYLDWQLSCNMLPKICLDWATANGYIENGMFNFSERHLAKTSGTKELHGNWPPNVWEAARVNGLLPEKDWPSEFISYDDYYKEIPAVLQVKAKEFLKYFSIKYQWIIVGQQADDNGVKDAIALYLKQSPLQTCSPFCPSWWSPLVIPCGKRNADHATMIYRIVKDVAIYIFDHYPVFRKVLSYLYPTDFVMQGIIEPLAVVPTPVVPHLFFGTDIYYGQRNNEVKKLQQALIYLQILKSGLDTGYYGYLTATAVKAFLVKYKITSSFFIYLNGGKYVGPLMRNSLNSMFP
jgi:hypothetical protein